MVPPAAHRRRAGPRPLPAHDQDAGRVGQDASVLRVDHPDHRRVRHRGQRAGPGSELSGERRGDPERAGPARRPGRGLPARSARCRAPPRAGRRQLRRGLDLARTGPPRHHGGQRSGGRARGRGGGRAPGRRAARCPAAPGRRGGVGGRRLRPAGRAPGRAERPPGGARHQRPAPERPKRPERTGRARCPARTARTERAGRTERTGRPGRPGRALRREGERGSPRHEHLLATRRRTGPAQYPPRTPGFPEGKAAAQARPEVAGIRARTGSPVSAGRRRRAIPPARCPAVDGPGTGHAPDCLSARKRPAAATGRGCAPGRR